MANITFCAHCGGPIVQGPVFPRVKQRIFDYIRKHPYCCTEEIMAAVYANDPNGGPDWNTVSAHLSQMRPILHELGLDIVSRQGPGATYRLTKFNGGRSVST